MTYACMDHRELMLSKTDTLDAHQYQFENQKCRDCKSIQYCILIEKDWFCEKCLGWSTKYTAKLKDDIKEMLIQCGIEKTLD